MTAIRAEFAAEVDRLAELATRSVGATSAGLDVLEPAIRAAMTAVGARLLGDLLSLDAGYRGPRSSTRSPEPAGNPARTVSVPAGRTDQLHHRVSAAARTRLWSGAEGFATHTRS